MKFIILHAILIFNIRFQEILGQNPDGSTQVWAARHRVRGDNVAIKIISKRKYDPKALQNEVTILKRLDHPNVVKLYDLFETKNSVYLVMEKLSLSFFMYFPQKRFFFLFGLVSFVLILRVVLILFVCSFVFSFVFVFVTCTFKKKLENEMFGR